MLATNDQTQTTFPPETDPGILVYLPIIAYFYLTFNSISTVFKAYTHGDFSMATFIVFVYVAYFCLMYCVSEFRALPPQENSPWKDFLKSAIWVLTNVIFLGFAYQFSTLIHPFAAVFVFAMAISASSILLLYFFHHQKQNQNASSCYKLRIKILRNSSTRSAVISDSKMRDVVPGPENV